MKLNSFQLSRRRFLIQSAAASTAAYGGLSSLSRIAAADENEETENSLRVIDVHVHANFHDPVLRRQAKTLSGVDYSAKGLSVEMKANGVEQGVILGFESDGSELSRRSANPMGLASFAENTKSMENVSFIGGINPHRLDRENLQQIEDALKSRQMKGLKIYLGYYYFHPDDDVYKPVYELAGKYKVPVVLHTGDTYSANAKVRFAHPLRIDDIAVDFRHVTFVLAHLGNPWTIDAAELLYKNPNVYADLSGFLVGNAAYFTDAKNAEGIDHAVDRIRRAFAWVEDPSKFLYGSDWPLVPMKPYIDFIKRAIPGEHHKRVFFENAMKVFKLS